MGLWTKKCFNSVQVSSIYPGDLSDFTRLASFDDGCWQTLPVVAVLCSVRVSRRFRSFAGSQLPRLEDISVSGYSPEQPNRWFSISGMPLLIYGKMLSRIVPISSRSGDRLKQISRHWGGEIAQVSPLFATRPCL